MEAVAKPVKPSSNVSEMVYRFAKVCKLRSLGVFSNESPNNKNLPLMEDGSEATTECEEYYQKIHPQPIEEDQEDLIMIKEDAAAATLILKLFDTISALKFAYIHLQQAHVPFNPEKIQSADYLVVSELKTLVDIKKLYKNITKPSKSVSVPPLLLEAVQDRANQVQKLQTQIEVKDAEIDRLKAELQELDLNNVEMEEKIKQKALEEENVGVCRMPTVSLFRKVFDESSKSIHDFAKPLINLMKASGWDLDMAVKSIEDSVIYSKRSHKKYAFEAYISRRMFHGFQEIPLQAHDVEDIGKYYRDALDVLVEEPDSNFGKFCRQKYMLVVHSKMEASFFRNLDHRRLVKEGKHPRTMFYQVFVKMARWVWLLRVIGASIEPKAEIFGVERGSEYLDVDMENVVVGDDESCEGDGRVSVGFMVMPGFRIEGNVIKSRVYLSKASNGGC